mgnify:CR=1 FL=1
MKKNTSKKYSFRTPEITKENFFKKIKGKKIGTLKPGDKCQRKFYLSGNFAAKCVNKGCRNARNSRDWKYWSFHPECSRCETARKNNKVLPGITSIKKNYCENFDGSPWNKKLGFKCPVKKNTKWQIFSQSLDIDHLDGDNDNNKLSNLKTWCKLCHMLKSKKAKDYDSTKKSGRKIQC